MDDTVHEVAAGLYRLAIPLPHTALGTVNAYVVASDDGLRLIDCGWDTPEAYAALEEGLARLGSGVRDIREIVVTHLHPDHFGLAARLARESGARELMHRRDALHVGGRYVEARGLVAEMEGWLATHGVPAPEIQSMAEASLWMLGLVGLRRPDVLLDGGEVLTWGHYRFEVIPTPGHSAGLICLYDAAERLLLSSDHVLERISPHIGLHAQSFGNPLEEYLASLRRVRDLDVDLVLPGHGVPFHGLAARVDAIMAHHEQRCAEMLRVLAGGAGTAYAVATGLPWRGSPDGWQRLSPFERRMAVTETVAHLEYLHARGQITRRSRDGIVSYE